MCFTFISWVYSACSIDVSRIKCLRVTSLKRVIIDISRVTCKEGYVKSDVSIVTIPEGDGKSGKSTMKSQEQGTSYN